MTTTTCHRESIVTNRAHLTYAPPALTLIGEAREVILGVSGSGDDFYGYTTPDFEFEPDGRER